MDYDKDYPVLTEEDFYPPQDDRVLRSGVDDIDGQSFSEYIEEYCELCDEEELYDEKILSY